MHSVLPWSWMDSFTFEASAVILFSWPLAIIYVISTFLEECWMIKGRVPGRTFAPITEPIIFSFDAPTWSLGKSMAAHISFGCICEVYNKDLEDTIYQICGRRDEQWEMIRTRKDGSIAAYIQEMNQHIRRYEN